jgi:hypothetical protein
MLTLRYDHRQALHTAHLERDGEAYRLRAIVRDSDVTPPRFVEIACQRCGRGDPGPGVSTFRHMGSGTISVQVRDPDAHLPSSILVIGVPEELLIP